MRRDNSQLEPCVGSPRSNQDLGYRVDQLQFKDLAWVIERCMSVFQSLGTVLCVYLVTLQLISSDRHTP